MLGSRLGTDSDGVVSDSAGADDLLASRTNLEGLAPVLDAIPAGVLLVGRDERVLHATPKAVAILGSSRPELEGQPLERVLAALSELTSTPPDASTGQRFALKGKKGNVIGFRIGAVSPEMTTASGPAYTILFQDITAVEKLREERNQLLRLAAVGEILPAVLHEIKNPLAAITTAVEVLFEEVAENHIRRELSAVLGEVRRIKLALEGIGIFRQELHSVRRSAVDRALREAFLVIEPQMKAKGIRGTLNVPDLPLLPLDSAVVRAFLFNLVTNSIHACEPGDSIDVTVSLPRGGDLEMVVRDSGCGMTPEVLSRCQELFFTTKSNGSGIGLALCTSVAESAGGRIAVESAPGAGTTVKVVLPLLAPRPSPAAP
ncbi:MAG: hypothetical protein IT186_08255 [Acidobacteria bacterium]|nr:hypothetical protein [Acidobacteriota bacterium]